MDDKPKVTARMRWIVKQMTDNGAVVQEHRDAFFEKSWYELWWQQDEPEPLYHSFEVKQRTLSKLIKAGMIEQLERKPVHDKGGRFVTSESTYGLPRAK